MKEDFENQDPIKEYAGFPQQCKASTRSGNQCRNNALPDSDYCHMQSHRPVAEAEWSPALSFVKDHWFASVSLIAALIGILAFVFYLNDKRTSAMSGELVSRESGHARYLSVGGERFKIDSPAGVLFRDQEMPLVSMSLVGNKLLVSTSIRGKEGDLIAELKDNEWQLNRKNAVFDRNYSDIALEVREQSGKVALQVVHLGDTIHLAGIFRCRSGWSTVIGPAGDHGSRMELKPPGESPSLAIPPICEYPSDRHLGSCPGAKALDRQVIHGDGPAYRMGGALDLCGKAIPHA